MWSAGCFMAELLIGEPIFNGKNESYLSSQKTAWREEKPGASEILDEYRRLKEIHGKDFQYTQFDCYI